MNKQLKDLYEAIKKNEPVKVDKIARSIISKKIQGLMEERKKEIAESLISEIHEASVWGKESVWKKDTPTPLNINKNSVGVLRDLASVVMGALKVVGDNQELKKKLTTIQSQVLGFLKKVDSVTNIEAANIKDVKEFMNKVNSYNSEIMKLRTANWDSLELQNIVAALKSLTHFRGL